MKRGACFWLSAAILLPTLAMAQAKPDTRQALNDGPLRVSYSDGTIVEIPRERGRVKEGDVALSQVEFSEIQLADDRVHIGWLADYLICAQSYQCHIAPVVFRGGHTPRYLDSHQGVVFGGWEAGRCAFRFTSRGFSRAVHAVRQRQWSRRGSFVPDPDDERPAPKWVQALQSRENKC
jgi:hypothetical protein